MRKGTESSGGGGVPPTYEAATAAASSAGASGHSHLASIEPKSTTYSLADVTFSMDLLTAAQREANFLRMIDRKAPVLYEEDVIRNAIRRYESFWLPLQAKTRDTNIVPPLDVHWVWHSHMLSPTHYRRDCEALVGAVVDHKLLSPEEIQERYEASVKEWQAHCPNEPYDFLASTHKRGAVRYSQKSTYDILGAVCRQRNFNYQISLPHYTSPKFLAEAVVRYQRFLFLKKLYPGEFFTPCYDFDLVWHTHQVHPSVYEQDMLRLLGKVLKHDDSVNDRSANSKLLRGEAATKKLWAHHFAGDPFWRRGSMYRGHMAPGFLGFDNQDLSNITYGNIHIPSITLKEIPVQREQLRLKLSYGSKKVTTFNADLSAKEVTKDGFCLVWQPTESSGASSIVKFPFEKRSPKDLLVELDLYDKVFLQKKELLKLIGRTPLEELLPPSNSKLAQNVATLTLMDKEGSGLKAKVSITTSLSLTRELQLSLGEFVGHELVGESRMLDMCGVAALNRGGVEAGRKVWVGTHGLVDARDGAAYTVQVLHSAPMLLTAVLVYGKDQRLLSMAHLIGPDSLPSRDQLDSNLQFLPHLSAADERAMVVLNKDGDFAIIKAKWSGFSKRVPPGKGTKGKPGNPGKLQVEAFNLLKNTVQKFELPGAEARLPGKRLQCKSTYMAEHLAAVFSVSCLFVLCNPDKVRNRSDNTSVGLQCHKWPLILAAGYGKDNPSNRYLALKRQAALQKGSNAGDSGGGGGYYDDDGSWLMYTAVWADAGGDIGDGGGCGACGACGACGSGGAGGEGRGGKEGREERREGSKGGREQAPAGPAAAAAAVAAAAAAEAAADKEASTHPHFFLPTSKLSAHSFLVRLRLLFPTFGSPTHCIAFSFLKRAAVQVNF